MMREILFRAWDKQRQEYLSGGEVFIAIQPGKNPRNVLYLDVLKDPDAYKDRFELEQYTGLTDKNGKKIFEGDCIGNRKNVVEFCNGGFSISGDFPLAYFKSYEVVGTIYDKEATE